jgi:hypothetical protein
MRSRGSPRLSPKLQTRPCRSGIGCREHRATSAEPLVEKIKEKILLHLYTQVWKIRPRTDHSHGDRANWLDEPAVADRIRTHCRIAGGLVGYRRIGAKKSDEADGIGWLVCMNA